MADRTMTIQTGNKTSSSTDSLTQYALFLGGTNVTKDVLANYDPLVTGFGRIFCVTSPAFLLDTIPSKWKKFKHILEYGNTAIDGISNPSVNFESIKGGYSGKSFEIPTVSMDDTNSLSITVYEFSGSPIREVLHSWINGAVDFNTTLRHYNGSKVEKLQSNQIAEFIYVNTDNSGENGEYVCMFANCFPKGLKTDVFNYESGEHSIVQTQIEFTATKYESIQINKLGQKLIDKYKLLGNSLNFHSGIDEDDIGAGFGYNIQTGKLDPSLSGKDTISPV